MRSGQGDTVGGGVARGCRLVDRRFRTKDGGRAGGKGCRQLGRTVGSAWEEARRGEGESWSAPGWTASGWSDWDWVKRLLGACFPPNDAVWASFASRGGRGERGRLVAKARRVGFAAGHDQLLRHARGRLGRRLVEACSRDVARVETRVGRVSPGARRAPPPCPQRFPRSRLAPHCARRATEPLVVAPTKKHLVPVDSHQVSSTSRADSPAPSSSRPRSFDYSAPAHPPERARAIPRASRARVGSDLARPWRPGAAPARRTLARAALPLPEVVLRSPRPPCSTNAHLRVYRGLQRRAGCPGARMRGSCSCSSEPARRGVAVSAARLPQGVPLPRT